MNGQIGGYSIMLSSRDWHIVQNQSNVELICLLGSAFKFNTNYRLSDH